MKKLFLLICFIFPFMLNAQQIEIEIVPDVENEMQQAEFDYQEMQFNKSFSNLSSGGYFGYLLNTDFERCL